MHGIDGQVDQAYRRCAYGDRSNGFDFEQYLCLRCIAAIWPDHHDTLNWRKVAVTTRKKSHAINSTAPAGIPRQPEPDKGFRPMNPNEVTIPGKCRKISLIQ